MTTSCTKNTVCRCLNLQLFCKIKQRQTRFDKISATINNNPAKNDEVLPKKKKIFTTSKVEQSAYFNFFWKFLIITSKKVEINEFLAGNNGNNF